MVRPGMEWIRHSQEEEVPEAGSMARVYPSKEGRESGTSAAAGTQNEVATLKAMMTTLVRGGTLTEEQKKVLEVSPAEQMKQEQRELNQKRKKLNRLRNLEQRLAENENKFDTWLTNQKLLVRQEKERYEAMQDQLRKDLAALQREEAMEEEEDEDLLGMMEKETDKDIYQNVEITRRVEAAEAQAMNAQQAMLQMQMQMQQLAAYTMQFQPPPGPPAEGDGYVPPLSPMAGAMPNASTSSPTLPKPVRNAQLKRSDKPPRKAKDANGTKDGALDVETITVEDDPEQTKGL